MGASDNNEHLTPQTLLYVSLKENIKSKYILKIIFSYLLNKKKLSLINYSKKYQNLLDVDLEDYKKLTGKKIIFEKHGYGTEYTLDTRELIFEGKYKNGKRNGKGKEYYPDGKTKFEGEYLNGKIKYGKKYDINGKVILKIDRNGKGKEYYNNGVIRFLGTYLNGKRWNGKGYNYYGNEIYELRSGCGKIKDYYHN